MSKWSKIFEKHLCVSLKIEIYQMHETSYRSLKDAIVAQKFADKMEKLIILRAGMRMRGNINFETISYESMQHVWVIRCSQSSRERPSRPSKRFGLFPYSSSPASEPISC